MMEFADEQVWRELRGSELSDYVRGPLKTHQSAMFALHLKSHGTQQDFSNWIEQHPDPCISACKMFVSAQNFAKVWLIEYLNRHPNSVVHHKVVVNLLGPDPIKFTHGVPPQALEVLDHIQYDLIDPSDRLPVFKLLFQGKQWEKIDRHWNIFEQTVQAMPPSFLPFAAFMGWDLHDKLKATPVDPIQYFVACCAGGLPQRVKQYTPHPSEDIKIGQALVQSVVHNQERPKIMVEIMEHLFDTYPAQPWHKTSESLSTVVAYAPLPFAQKIITHFANHAPHVLKEQSEGLACHALFKKNYKLLDALFPHVDPNDYHKVFQNALMNKRKVALKTLLHKCTENNVGHEGFYKALEDFPSKTQQWANEIYATYQKQTLHNKLQARRNVNPRSAHKKI